ncbi:MAG: class II aldolase/adducin family protein [Chloroflexi bacterium]|nr:class II aldolase/adducin family protein [Chloroflexota bacterium]
MSLAVAGHATEAHGGGVVLYPVDPLAPRSYRRRSQAIFVVGLAAVETAPEDILRTAYPLLVRSLSNIFILLARTGQETPGPAAYFITLEQGYYAVPHPGEDQAFFTAVADRLAPLATSRLIIDNIFDPDLPAELWDGDPHTESITRAGQRLAALDLLPAPFPVQDLLSPEDYRHVLHLFGIGGLSYGNISARKDGQRFWMTASGVDKSHLHTVGQEMLLVKGYDPQRGAILLSVPPHRPPRRVSVDAIEHVMIYREHPGVGAILHIHAWMEGICSTQVNYPCGTVELAQEVAELVRQAEDPTRAVVGLKNHGLTITGLDLDEIFARIGGRILRQVPMS